MAVSAKAYGKFFTALNSGSIQWTTASIKCALAGSSYSPNQDTDDFFNDVTDEVSGSSYTASGLTLTASQYYTASTNTHTLDLADAIWTSSSFSARYAVLYHTLAACSGSISPLVAYVDFGETMTSQGGAFTITWNTDGILSYTTAS